ncbi:MAG: LLM class flavin-dependent oxidoreductase [Chloroflexi bacterium]|nr:LLM class flavin-dependent oxidoreductase [Chloroflexota bacterium]
MGPQPPDMKVRSAVQSRPLQLSFQPDFGPCNADKDEFSLKGEFSHTENLVTQPKLPRDMQILVGGGVEQVAMRIAAQHADIWNTSVGAQDDLEHKVSVLRGHAERLGRDHSEIRVSQPCLVTMVDDDAKVQPMVERAQKISRGLRSNSAGETALIGTPA